MFFIKNATFDRRFTEFGGSHSSDGTFAPTGDTVAWLAGGNDLRMRFRVQALLEPDHPLVKHQVLSFAPSDRPGPSHSMKTPLDLSEEQLALFTTGRPHRPRYGAGFPAQFIETALTWEDLILHPGTRRQVEQLHVWLEHGDTLLHDWGMAPKLRPGYRALFYGPPGTGKTITACLLGKTTGRDVYKIDLSMMVSKWIGETEKNLARVFDAAQSRGWILFFDEAEALFGKRSETRDARDRYANQEVSFLLQRIETFDGITILASNFRENLDTAFARRFESVVYFPIPRPEDQLTIWRRAFSPKVQLEGSVDLEALVRTHPLSGGRS